MSRENLDIQTPDDVIALLAPIMEGIANLAADRVIARGGPRPPEGPYVQLDWLEITGLPQNHGEYTDEEGQVWQVLRNECSGVVRIWFFGERAFDAAVMAIGWLDCDHRTFDLWKDPLGYGGTGKVSHVPQEFGAEMQARAYFDLNVNLAFEAAYPVDFFEASQWRIRQYPGDGDTPREEDHIYPETTP